MSLSSEHRLIYNDAHSKWKQLVARQWSAHSFLNWILHMCTFFLELKFFWWAFFRRARITMALREWQNVWEIKSINKKNNVAFANQKKMNLKCGITWMRKVIVTHVHFSMNMYNCEWESTICKSSAKNLMFTESKLNQNDLQNEKKCFFFLNKNLILYPNFRSLTLFDRNYSIIFLRNVRITTPLSVEQLISPFSHDRNQCNTIQCI